MTTRKYRNLTAIRKACFAIGWEGEQTVQFEGEAFVPEGVSWIGIRACTLRHGRMDRRGRVGRGSFISLFVRGGFGIAISISGRRD